MNLIPGIAAVVDTSLALVYNFGNVIDHVRSKIVPVPGIIHATLS